MSANSSSTSTSTSSSTPETESYIPLPTTGNQGDQQNVHEELVDDDDLVDESEDHPPAAADTEVKLPGGGVDGVSGISLGGVCGITAIMFPDPSCRLPPVKRQFDGRMPSPLFGSQLLLSRHDVIMAKAGIPKLIDVSTICLGVNGIIDGDGLGDGLGDGGTSSSGAAVPIVLEDLVRYLVEDASISTFVQLFARSPNAKTEAKHMLVDYPPALQALHTLEQSTGYYTMTLLKLFACLSSDQEAQYLSTKYHILQGAAIASSACPLPPLPASEKKKRTSKKVKTEGKEEKKNSSSSSSSTSSLTGVQGEASASPASAASKAKRVRKGKGLILAWMELVDFTAKEHLTRAKEKEACAIRMVEMMGAKLATPGVGPTSTSTSTSTSSSALAAAGAAADLCAEFKKDADKAIAERKHVKKLADLVAKKHEVILGLDRQAKTEARRATASSSAGASKGRGTKRKSTSSSDVASDDETDDDTEDDENSTKVGKLLDGNTSSEDDKSDDEDQAEAKSKKKQKRQSSKKKKLHVTNVDVEAIVTINRD
jgi:hypothetical protein